MSLVQRKIDVLNILTENLAVSSPQLVPTSAIANRMNIRTKDLLPILKTMNGLGFIQTDDDLQYNLITQKGLLYIERQDLLR